LRYGNKVPLPWDIIVLLTITMVGFGLSVKKVRSYVSIVKETTSSYGLTSNNISRNIATNYTSSRPADSTSFLVDLGCIDKKENVEVESLLETIRIKVGFCSNNSPIKEISIFNETTSQSSSVVFLGPNNTFMSDYITLNKGRNKIRIGWMDSTSSGVLQTNIIGP